MTWQTTLEQLEQGTVRAAFKNDQGQWQANESVKKSILSAFKAGENIQFDGVFEGFIDKANLPPRKFNLEDKVRMVPGGSSVRCGAYVAPGVIIMPPAYINIGAFVDQGSMIDSHALVGSCAQIGKNVHISAAVQIGGVLEPVGAKPVIVEDDAFIGAGSVLVEGVVIGKRAVIAPGVCLSGGVPIYDCVHQKLLSKGSAIPDDAVVVPGSRTINSTWANEMGLSLACAMIIKYRDDKSDAALVLEQALR